MSTSYLSCKLKPTRIETWNSKRLLLLEHCLNQPPTWAHLVCWLLSRVLDVSTVCLPFACILAATAVVLCCAAGGWEGLRLDAAARLPRHQAGRKCAFSSLVRKSPLGRDKAPTGVCVLFVRTASVCPFPASVSAFGLSCLGARVS